MIDGGLVLILIGALSLLVAPLEREIAHRRWAGPLVSRPGLVIALRIASPSPPPFRSTRPIAGEVVRRADAALAREPLIQGIRGVAAIYDRA